MICIFLSEHKPMERVEPGNNWHWIDSLMSWAWQYVTHPRSGFATGLMFPYIYNISEDAAEAFAFTSLNICPFHKSQLIFSCFISSPL